MPRPRAVLPRLLAVAALAVGPLLLAGPAAAQEPLRLDDQITDDAGVLSADDRARVQTALDQLRADEGLQLFVVFEDTFDGTSGPDWATETAQLSGFGDGDVLLAVAVESRDYGTSIPVAVISSSDDQLSLETDQVEPHLADEDWAGAAIAMADGLSPSNTGWYVLGGAVAVAALGGGGYAVVRRRRRAAEEAEAIRKAGPYPDQSTEQLTNRASEGLLAVDEAVRTSQLDLDFARLQYGEAGVAGFAGTVGNARTQLAEAFSIRQQLDDEVPEDEPTQRRMLARVLELLQAADDQLDAQATEFAALRDLEANAPQVLAGLGPRLTAMTGRLPAEEERLAQLGRRWAASALAPVADVPARVREQLAAAEQATTAAQTELQAGRTGPAVPSLRTAEDAAAAAQASLDSLAARAQELNTAAAAVPAARAEVEAGLVAAGRVDPTDAAGMAEPVTQARDSLGVADQLMAGPTPDPIAALARLDAADDALDAALATAQTAAVERRAAVARAERALVSARSSVSSAGAAVAGGRDWAGTTPRTRLSEAERLLAAAEAAFATDPAGSSQSAARASSLAEEAVSLVDRARRERESRSSYSGGGGFFGGSGGGWSGGSSYRGSSGRSSGRSSSSSGRRSGGGRSSGARRSGGGRF
ncbi:TLP18.3, Psb32 and MOLO-1 founding protein of phosphatase [Klenkia soli]|uniref:TLP18.3, Psb32 and MOLO-1 founding protein of phosphatase n=1 Tax=Klenkia soli TaxID=1052260 RepID=A0A1H0MZV4_9ACTN|nr:TPM domain-containing protein [Klenkia soli]SDO85923.1 TLP18.3, Psb32 and MOLO-1 founding protein of phosphatase [Klenkia soli]